MCEKFTRSIFISIIFMFVMTSGLNASGKLSGYVSDSQSGQALIGANVFLDGTSFGSATDFDGNFYIPAVPAGDYNLICRYLGYEDKTLPVTVQDGKNLFVEFALDYKVVEGQVVTVTAQVRGQLSAINQQLSSNSIINAVSAEKMQELPDANLAESIGRLPGLSLQRSNGEAEKVVIRGLSPKYNNVTIEGVPLTSTNYFDRSIDLSLIADDLVKGVEVSKTLRPDMDADALGGTINLTLKTAQEGFHYDIKANGGYNKLGDSFDNYKFAGGVSNRFFDNLIGVQLQGNMEQKQLPSDQFSAAFAAPQYSRTDSSFTMGTNSATLIENRTKRHRYGLSLLLDYSSDFVDIKFLNVYDQKNDNVIRRNNITNFNSGSFLTQLFATNTKIEQRTHSMQFLFKLGQTELPVSVSYTRGDSHSPNGQQFDFYESGSGAGIAPIPADEMIFGQPADLLNLMGVQSPTFSTLQQMYVSNTDLTDEEYDVKVDWKVPIKFSDDFTGNLSAGGKFHQTRRTSDNKQEFDYIQYGAGAGNRIDLVNSFPFLTGANTGISSGIEAKYFVDNNYSRTDILGYTIGKTYDLDLLLNMQNAYYPTHSRKVAGLYYQSGLNDYNQDYDDKESTTAGYIMGEFNLGNKLTIVPGVRFQEQKTDIQAYHIIRNVNNQNGLAGEPVRNQEKRTHPYWYPSVNIKYKATDNLQFLGAVYKSVSLPSFGEITPMVIYQDATNNPRIIAGNPVLKPSTAWNLDFVTSVFSNDIGLFTVNIFYKEISDLIYAMQNYQPFLPYPVVGAPDDFFERVPETSYFDSSWAAQNSALTASANIPLNNPDKAYIRGIEFSWQTNLWYLPWVLNGIVLDLNLSFMSSSQFYPSFEQVQTGGTPRRPEYSLIYQTRKGHLQDQPKAIYNAIVGWDYMGFSSRFSFRYQQTTLTNLDTKYSLRDSYYDNVLLIDISLKQQIMDNLSLFVNTTNINSHIDNYYLSVPSGDKLPTSKQTYGWNAQFGVSYRY